MNIFQKSKHAALRGIAMMLPRHAKRVVLWSSLYSKMCSAKEVPIENTKRLNKILNLAQTDEAVALPAHMRMVVWRDLEPCSRAINDAVGGQSLDECAKRFASSIPRFLTYASEHYVTEDFMRLVRAHRRSYGALA